jgi:hypothetical protein
MTLNRLRQSVWGPVWDHALCALVNDVRVSTRIARKSTVTAQGATWEMRCRYLLGVKWETQVMRAD